MKKIALLIVLLFSIRTFSQENDFKYPQDEDKKTELKISTTSLIIFGALDVSYERLINKNTSYGASIFINTDKEYDLDFNRNFTIAPFYRWFFSERKFARGFFIEGFGSINSTDDSYDDGFFDASGNYQSVTAGSDNNVRFALGISVGGKFVLKTGFTAEVFLGIGRNLIGDDSYSYYYEREFIPRGGVSLGYRF